MMKKIFLLTFLVLSITNSYTQTDERVRLIILADMGNEPDEVQQMVHMMLCSNEFYPEGLIAVTGKYLRPESNEVYRRVTHPELFHNIIDAYEKVLDNLKKHDTGWHSAAYLHSIVCSGQTGYGIEDVGEGKQSKGSELIIKSLEKEDDTPIWVVVNAGSNTLAQALLDFENKHNTSALKQAISKLRVFENGAQDNAGAWICSRYPNIHWIRSNYQTYAYGGPGGKDGDLTVNLGPHFWGNYAYNVSGQNEWLKEHAMNNHGPLGKVYPERRYHGFRDGGLGFMEGGGTIPWIGLVNHGLFDINHPSWGGWGGRFSIEKAPDFWSRHLDIYKDEKSNSPFYTYREVSDVWYNEKDKKFYHGNYVPVWRWREAMYNNFKCRMDWCVKPYNEANHQPIAAFGDDTSNSIIEMNVMPEDILDLDASNSSDPDKDSLKYKWWIYNEAGTYPGAVFIENPNDIKTKLHVPSGAAGKQLHVILEVKDTNSIGSLFDYRRIVLNVSNLYNHVNISQQKD
ncbi:nucleoside hydrolase-like domain-containing protein [Seonamhaeicola marinus]|uniref:DUF1593 domain-containing protein n=1 Tax=Seonamhaeicola marinus TaxID=1912246 RepID=A0A5D0HVQ2_9FLAO|nr:nucleoside hydrolase-like domain-containing protein [Seonamhaeicola marinus]TYA74197.1 DUF1593 domain-containing protein [Seonamhaeicola marinus]